jgi:hypothetical protein
MALRLLFQQAWRGTTMAKLIVFIGFFLSSSFALAQSCQDTAYNDVQNCFDAIKGAKSQNDANAGIASGMIPSQGVAAASDTTSNVGVAAMGNWKIAKDVCKKKLQDCQSSCQSPTDSQYLKACEKSIQDAITAANAQEAGSQSYAQSTRDETTLTKSSDSKFDDSVIGSERNPASNDVQQVGLFDRAVAACKIGAVIAGCITNPGAQPTLQDAYRRPAVIRIEPSGVGQAAAGSN